MKGKFTIKGFEMKLSVKDESSTNMDYSFKLEENTGEYELDKEEFTHLHNLVAEDCKDLRDKIAVPFMTTFNKQLDKLGDCLCSNLTKE